MLEPTALVDDSLKQSLQAFVVQGAATMALNIPNDLAFSLGIEDLNVPGPFDFCDLDRTTGPLVQ
jgi:hypothetical protein